MANLVRVNSSNVRYGADFIESVYTYETSVVSNPESVTSSTEKINVSPRNVSVTLRTKTKVPRIGMMLVGLGGNNGTTLTAAILANKLGMSWRTKEGIQKANFLGSLTQSSVFWLGSGPKGEDIYVPFNKLMAAVHPNDIHIDGWDISGLDLAAATERATVLDVSLQDQLRPLLREIKPRPAVYWPDFIAANQADRADNVINGTKQQQVDKLRADIRDFKAKRNLDTVIVLWTANTERFCDIVPGLNDTCDNLLNAIRNNASEVSPSTMYAVASALEGCTYINGSPQNTFVPGLVELAKRQGTFIAGDDFKTGQTKIKSVLVDFLVGAGIKPVSIVSYNHLGNNDGKNLSAPKQFRSKEISKSNVVDDMVAANHAIYKPGEHPDHCVVIKYVPYVGDSKRAMDEYTSEIMCGGKNTIVLHNTCEDSLLASPIILDLVIMAELLQRVTVKVQGETEFQPLHNILSLLSYLLKAPLVPKGTPVVNALFRQRSAFENFIRSLVGLPPVNHLQLEHRLSDPTTINKWLKSPTAYEAVAPPPRKISIKKLTVDNGFDEMNLINGTH